MALASKFGGGAAQTSQTSLSGQQTFLSASLDAMFDPMDARKREAFAAVTTVHCPDRASDVSSWLASLPPVETGAPAPVSARKLTTGNGF